MTSRMGEGKSSLITRLATVWDRINELEKHEEKQDGHTQIRIALCYKRLLACTCISTLLLAK